MNVPRTYISKIENGKAMPTLSSLDRLARALQVDISALLRDAPPAHRTKRPCSLPIPSSPRSPSTPRISTPTQKSIFLNHVRELAQNRTRTA